MHQAHVLFAGLLSLPLAFAPSDWPQYRGPDRNGISKETGWVAEGKEEPLWRINVGLGYSSVSVVDGRLYTMGHDEERGLDVVWCLDAETGEEIWTHTYASEIWKQMHSGGTLTTPSVDGDLVYTTNREGSFFCLDAKTGKVRWSKQLKDELGLELPTWGLGASPLVLDDMMILNVGPVVAMKRRTGEVIWKSSDYGHAYSTPFDFELDGKPCLASFGSKGLAILDRSDGSELWFHEWKTMYDINAMTPVVFDGKVFISSGLGHGAALLKMGGDELEVLWETRKMRNKMSGCVLIGGNFYGFDETVLACIGPDGEEQWRMRAIKNGALTAADGKLLIINSHGELIVAEATPEEFRELSRVAVLDGGINWTTPILVNGLIYVRNNEGDLACLDHRAEQ